ncbi:hypothetical protein F3J23_08200 [Chryseobacterium sp. Tr-659]|uniref:hypothetical protein n=1 Tax=Chryseobacterium sp. Tr-659 TaxID=2608340 RepID=UPI001423730F|nr:hypothetical protein [Chryseobacterium sp. Tr-659]NIF05423.1 hypothetical protein [Chryseobacterium sp. Tr-659]
MKKYFICPIFALIFCNSNYAQVVIGNSAQFLTAGGVLDLSNEAAPLVVPNIGSQPADAVEGTVIFDSSVNKVIYKKDTGWEELTKNTGIRNVPTVSFTGIESRGVIIGNTSTQAPGVLVLESSNMGLVLPRANTPQNIVEPTSGSVIYDESKKMLAVYNGVEWSFWEVPLIISSPTISSPAGTAINQNVSIAYTGGKGTTYPAGNSTQNGVTIAYPAGILDASGTINAQVSGTPAAAGTIIFKINEGNQSFDLVKIVVN